MSLVELRRYKRAFILPDTPVAAGQIDTVNQFIETAGTKK